MKMLILPIIGIILALILIFNLIKIVNKNRKEKRISEYSLSKKDFDDTTIFEKIIHFIWKLVHYLSNLISQSKYFVKKSSKYEKYILVKEEKYKSPIDYFTVKIITLIIVLILYFGLVLTESINFNIIMLVVTIILSYCIPDFMWNMSYNQKCNDIRNKLYESIIIIDDNLSKTNIYNAINKVIDQLDDSISDEYQRILIDLSYNISISQAYKRFYERTKIKEIEIIYNVLNVDQSNLEDAFKIIRNQFSYYDTLNNNKESNNTLINIFKYTFISIPLLLVLLINILDSSYLKILISDAYGVLIIEILAILYILLILILNLVLEVGNE